MILNWRENITQGTSPTEVCDKVQLYAHLPLQLNYHTENYNPTCRRKKDKYEIRKVPRIFKANKFSTLSQTVWMHKGMHLKNLKYIILIEKIENLLKPSSIHAHYKTKYFFTSSLHDTCSLHHPTTAPWKVINFKKLF